MPRLAEMGDPVLAGAKRNAEKEDGPCRANTQAIGRSPEREKGPEVRIRTEHSDEIGTNPLNGKVIESPKKDNFMLTRDPGELSGEPRLKLSMAKGS
jgi:hypothetical protein